MICPSVLTCSQYADGALSSEDAAAMARHLTDCASCRERVEAFTGESRAIGCALRAAEIDGLVPGFEPPQTISAIVAWIGWIVLAGWAVNVAWLSLASAAYVPSWLDWLIPDAAGMGIDLAVSLTLNLLNAGGDALDGTLRAAGSIVLVGVGAAGAWLLMRPSMDRAGSLCLSVGVIAMLVATTPAAHAIELRRDEDRVTVGADETVDDTLIVAADVVRVEGTVTGDLIAFGDRVIVRGSIGGTLVAAGDEVDVEGDISGNVIAAAETLELREVLVGGNFYGAGQTITVGTDTHVSGNVSLAAGEAAVRGRVGRDVLTRAGELSLSGNVEGNLTAYGDLVEIDSGGRVGGDVTVKVRSAEHLRVAPDAVVEGDTNLDLRPEEKSRYLSLAYYLRQSLRLLAAFVTGLAIFYLFPALSGVQLERGGEGLKTVAFGIVALVATPALAVAVILTLIGAPLGIVALLLWLAALYAASIVTAGLLGRMVLDGDAHSQALTLLVGLFIVFVLVSLPFIGGMFRLVAIVVGLGLMARWIMALWTARTAS